VPPVVQIYNILGLVDVYRFADAMDMEVTMNILHMPDRLAIHHLPPRVPRRRPRADGYHGRLPPLSKPSVISLARYLDGSAVQSDVCASSCSSPTTSTHAGDHRTRRTRALLAETASPGRQTRFADGERKMRPAKGATTAA
jgi:hypothetical protein